MAKINWRNVNLYQDDSHGGWVLEFRCLEGDRREWFFVGVYGTREAAMRVVRGNAR